MKTFQKPINEEVTEYLEYVLTAHYWFPESPMI